MAMLLGLDGGGSHTEAVLSDEHLHDVARHRGPPGNVTRGKESEAADRLVKVIRDALAATDRSGPIEALVIGAAGAGDPQTAEALRGALIARLQTAQIDVVTDIEIAFWSVFPEGEGIVLSGGTGSIALGRQANGQSMRTGGHGWRFGDDGSGYAIGRAAVNAALRAREHRGPATSLTRLLPVDDELRGWLASLTPRTTAEFTRDVARAAAAGDDVAGDILERAAYELVEHVAAVRNRLESGAQLDVAFNGGLLDPELPVRALVVEELNRRALRVQVVDAVADPGFGALRMAKERWAAGR